MNLDPRHVSPDVIALNPDLFSEPVKKPPRIRSSRVIVDGIQFASQTEANRYAELQLLEKAGEIRHLSLQPRFELKPATDEERAIHYTADFMYHEDFQGGGGMMVVVEEVKSSYTAKERDYVLRRKMFRARYPHYEFREVVK